MTEELSIIPVNLCDSVVCGLCSDLLSILYGARGFVFLYFSFMKRISHFPSLLLFFFQIKLLCFLLQKIQLIFFNLLLC